MEKKVFILLLVLFLIKAVFLEAEHSINIINQTDRKVSVLISTPSYYKSYSLQEVSVDKNSSCYHGFDNKSLKCAYYAYVQFDDDIKLQETKYIQYYNFLDDTLNITINNDSITFSSSNGYDKELNYSSQMEDANSANNFLGFSNHVTIQENRLKENITTIQEIGFKSQKLKDYLIEDARFETQINILDYLIENTINTDNYIFKDLSDIYEEKADFDIINNPTYYNNAKYNQLMDRLIKYRQHLVDEIPFKIFRKSKQEEVFTDKLSDFACQVIEINQLHNRFNLQMDKRNNVREIVSLMKDVKNDTNYYPQIKNDLLKLLKVELMISEGLKFPISEFVGLDGKRISMDDYIGNVVVIYFYSFYCSGAVEAFPVFQEIKENMADKNIKFMFINCDRTIKDWQKGIIAYNMADYINVYTGGGTIDNNKYAKQLNISKVPYVIILDTKGNNYEFNSYIYNKKLFEMKIKLLLWETKK